jgi:hypothetical protein
MSQSNYPSPVPAGEVIKRLRDAAATSCHEFWADDLSILDRTVVDRTRIHGPKQVTDVYLLALAVRHSGRFVTFDGAGPLSAVLRAETGASCDDLNGLWFGVRSLRFGVRSSDPSWL